MAAFSSARSAYIRFSFAFSASSSRSRFTSEIVAPPYLLRHLKKVALLTPCFRVRSATGTALSASLTIATIWVSLNFEFRKTAPDPQQSTFGCHAIGEAYAGGLGVRMTRDKRRRDGRLRSTGRSPGDYSGEASAGKDSKIAGASNDSGYHCTSHR